MKIKDMFTTEEDPKVIPNEWFLERFRNWRFKELQSSDWTQLSDSPAIASDWATYRQALRDLPSIADFSNAQVPKAPGQ